MEGVVLEEVLACLDQQRTLFPYFKDRFAFLLLADEAKDGVQVQTLKRGRFGRLFDKPAVKAHLARCGGGRVTRAEFDLATSDAWLTFLITVGGWEGRRASRWTQVSRPGWNLVLRLHCPVSVDGLLWEQLEPDVRCLLGYEGHPVLGRSERPYYRETLAWARMDFDLDTGEALIEELQTDWVRSAEYLRGRLERVGENGDIYYGGQRLRASRCRAYIEALRPYAAVWEEALLIAVIEFLRKEIGLRSIYLHDWDSGNRVKRIDGGAPPKRLYTSLPKRFCFEKSEAIPRFLANDKRFTRRVRRFRSGLQWHHLAA